MDAAAYLSLRELQDEHWWFVGRRLIIRRLLEKYLPPVRDAKLLEAGCGYGGNLPLLTEFGQVSAFEFDDRARQFARQNSGVDVRPGFLPDGVVLGAHTFDLVAMFDVLEHIDDDVQSVKTLAGALAKQGRMIITVPAFDWLWSPHDDLHHHKRRYSRDQLERCIRGAGMQPIAIGYFNSLLFPLAVVQRMAARLHGSSPGPEKVPPAPLNSALRTILGWERHLVGRSSLPFGLSLYAVAEHA